MSEEKTNEVLSLSDLGLEEEVTPAKAAETSNTETKEGIIKDSQSQNPIEVKKVDMDMSEFQSGPKRKIPRPDNIKPIGDSSSQQTVSAQGDLKVEHSTDANAGYSTVNISDIAKTYHKTKPEDAVKKTLATLAEQTEAGIQRTKNELTAPGGRIEEGKRKYVHDRYNTLMGRAQQSPNLMKKIKTYQEIMESDPAFDGADEYEKKAYILFKVAKDTSIGIDDKSFGLAQESLRKVRQSSADTSKRIEKMSKQAGSDDLDNDDRIIFDQDDEIPTVKKEIKKKEEKEVLEEKLEIAKEDLIDIPVKKTVTVIADPVKKDDEDDEFDKEDLTIQSDDQEENLITLKDDKDDDIFDDERTFSDEDRDNAGLAKEFGLSIEKFNEIQKAYITQAKEVLHLDSSSISSEEYAGFNTSNRSLTMNEALRIAKRSRPQQLNVRWALQYTGIPIRISAFSGEELVQFLSDIETGYNQARQGSLPSIDQLTSIWGTIYNHVEMENKPNFNTWLRRISANDFANFIFAIYMAIFKDTNYLTYRCPKKGCAKLYLEKHDVMEMIKFPNKKVEDRIKAILNGESVESMVYRTEPVPINETFAMSFITPSVYSFNFEQAAIPYQYRQEHTISGLMMAIDKVYIIDKSRNQFLPIEFGVVQDDLEKTVKRKIKALERIFSTFTLDQRNLILAEYQKITEILETEQIQYVLPKSKCPVCGTEIPEEDSNAFTLLFTRARLSIDAASIRG